MGYGVSWNHYTPYRALEDFESSVATDKARFLLPATWMTFTVDNREGRDVKRFLFSLLDKSPSAQQVWTDHCGFVLTKRVEMSHRDNEADVLTSTHAVAISSKIGKLLTPEQVLQQFGIAGATTAVVVEVPPGKWREFTIFLGHYNDQPLLNTGKGKLYLTRYYDSIHSVVRAAIQTYPAARRRAEAYLAEVQGWDTNDYRRFLFGHALASYMFNTRFFLRDDGQYLWSVIEGEYDYINTFDLVIDQVFLELGMHPWTVRNELDLYASNFHYVDKIKTPDTASKVFDGGLALNHDMGSAFSYKTPEQVALPYP